MKFLSYSLSLLVLVILAGCAGTGLVSPKEQISNLDLSTRSLASLSDGEYRGEATVSPPLGTLVAMRKASVTVTIRDHRIVSIAITEPATLDSDDKFIALKNRMIASGSADVDGVSGATYSSSAVRKAVAKAVSP